MVDDREVLDDDCDDSLLLTLLIIGLENDSLKVAVPSFRDNKEALDGSERADRLTDIHFRGRDLHNR